MNKGDLVFSIEIRKKETEKKSTTAFELGKGVGYYHAFQIAKFMERFSEMEISEFETIFPREKQMLDDVPLFSIKISSDGENHFFDTSIAQVLMRFDQTPISLLSHLKSFQISIVNNLMKAEAKKAIIKNGFTPNEKRIGRFFDKQIKKYIHNREESYDDGRSNLLNINLN